FPSSITNQAASKSKSPARPSDTPCFFLLRRSFARSKRNSTELNVYTIILPGQLDGCSQAKAALGPAAELSSRPRKGNSRRPRRTFLRRSLTGLGCPPRLQRVRLHNRRQQPRI